MSRLDIRLLGPPEVDLDEKPIQVDTRKAIALLAYLAVTGEPHRRDSLAAFFWPESNQMRARAALRRTLSSLSRALGGGWLAINRETIALDRANGYRLDIEGFRCGIDHARSGRGSELGDLRDALALYRGEFMAGFSLRDSPPFDDWQYLQAEAVRRDLAWLLEQLTDANIETGNWDAALDYARRWLYLDPLQEMVHRRLMQVHAERGDRTGAIRQYRECVQILDRELGVGPLEETTALYQSIMGSAGTVLQVSAGTARKTTKHARLPAQFPLVGRDEERVILLRAYGSTEQQGRLVAIEGEAGIGKSRLAAELVDYARSKGASVVSVVCYAGEADIAYGVVAGLIRSSLETLDADRAEGFPSHVRSEISRIIPDIGEAGATTYLPLDSPGALDRFYDSIVQLFAALGQPSTPALLFVDDLQWADQASLNVLSYLIRRLHRLPLCVVVAWRSEDVPPSHPLRQLLARLKREDAAVLVSLNPLTEGDIADLVASDDRLGDGEMSRTLFEESEGIPFFAVEYLAYLGDEPKAGERSWPIPGGVRDLIHSRLLAVGETGYQLLTTAAVIGRSFDFDLLREASGRSAAEVVETLDQLLPRGLIRESSGVAGAEVVYDFSHEKVRTLLYEETSLARRRLIHQRVAGALERRARHGRSSGLAGQIAYHLRLAGLEAEAAVYYRQAGDDARALYGNAEALSHYRMALALGHPDPAYLHEAIGDLETLDGSYLSALQSYQAAAAHAETGRLSAIEHKLGGLRQRLGDWALAERHYEAAFAALDVDQPAERARALAGWSLTAHQSGDTRRAVRIGHQSLELAMASNDDATLAQTHNLLGILARSQGEPVETARHLEQSLRYANSMSDPAARIAALNNLALVCADQGEVERAIELTREALELCRSIGDRHREAALLNNLADFSHMASDEEHSMAYLKDAVAIFAEIDQRTDTIRPEIWKLVEW